MNYPKPYMSITELVSFTGLSRDYFKTISLSIEAPTIRTNGGGKIYFNTSKLDAFMEKVSDARKNKEESI